ncbi:MAG: hypothetical protein HWN65_07515 [Candidatus Helarchaeota archaeon]|nr:hypothetical protein [Candidatus Helarchaeota archaeon]
MGRISEIWIINEAGIPLFNRSIEEKIDVLLFGGFLSAIQTFIKSSFQEEKLDRLVLGDSKLTFFYIEEYHIFIVIRTHKKVKDKDIDKFLELIKDLFISNYKDKLEQERYDMADFSGFNEVLEEKFDEGAVVKRMKNWFAEV